MSVARQLHQLQEIDLKLESNEQALRQLASQLGESQAVVGARNEFASERQCLEELRRQQHAAEWEIDDLVNKLTTAEEKLYSGGVRNPKELTNLQHEVDELKARRSQLEDSALEIMDQVELAMTMVENMSGQLERLETEWHGQQEQLSGEIQQLKTTLYNLEHERQLLLTKIDPQSIEFYVELKKQKGTAVAKVEQGVCHGCRISLPTTDLQQARSGNLVQCSSCGRILFLS